MKYKSGDKVKVISNDGVYTTYLNWLTKNSRSIFRKLSHWVYGRKMDEFDLNDEWTVIHSSPHLETSDVIIVFIDNGKKSFMISENCLVSKDDSDYDAKDILKQLVTLIEGNKGLLEKAKKILKSV